MSSFNFSKYEDKMTNEWHPWKEVSCFNCYDGNMQRGETETVTGYECEGFETVLNETKHWKDANTLYLRELFNKIQLIVFVVLADMLWKTN